MLGDDGLPLPSTSSRIDEELIPKIIDAIIPSLNQIFSSMKLLSLSDVCVSFLYSIIGTC
jgi:hypothetical protein